jgi:hypothetical protein
LRIIQKPATSMSPAKAIGIGDHRMRERIRVTSRVVPAGPGSSCHSQEMSPGVPQILDPAPTSR